MKISEMTWPEIGEAAGKTVAVLPLASTEQHGPHLSVFTDSSIAAAMAEEVERRMPRDVALCPPLYYGSSDHHLAFPGTMSVHPDRYSRLVEDLVKSLLAAGFRRIVLFNGHGGNTTPVRQALARLSHEFDRDLKPNIALATYWELGGKAFAGDPPMESPALTHSCEYETSLMLHLFPERVKMAKAKRGKRPPQSRYIPWEEEMPYRGVSMVKQTQFISDGGGSGDPKLATADKGKHLYSRAVEAAVEFISDFRSWPLMEDLRRS